MTTLRLVSLSAVFASTLSSTSPHTAVKNALISAIIELFLQTGVIAQDSNNASELPLNRGSPPITSPAASLSSFQVRSTASVDGIAPRALSLLSSVCSSAGVGSTGESTTFSNIRFPFVDNDTLPGDARLNLRISLVFGNSLSCVDGVESIARMQLASPSELTVESRHEKSFSFAANNSSKSPSSSSVTSSLPFATRPTTPCIARLFMRCPSFSSELRISASIEDSPVML
mmetsp:Transcript_1384/g.2249  ORF Transcript_1384/g.2249 Transcript_1384/m.2249 type:complete len:230 (+) Transcript_1384:1192-1881(+)